MKQTELSLNPIIGMSDKQVSFLGDVIMGMYRQGDVLLVKVNEIPNKLEQEKGPIILAHGEVTGHAHRIRSKSAKVFSGTAGRYLQVMKPSVLEHEEHGPIDILEGLYQVVIQREYSPTESRQVID